MSDSFHIPTVFKMSCNTFFVIKMSISHFKVIEKY